MKRFLSVWLPAWPVERLERHEPGCVPGNRPFALVEADAHGLRITAVNLRAAAEGLDIGTALADARAVLPGLVVKPAEPVLDARALLRLARWSGRYGPARNRDGIDGLWIDTTGVAHLFGGEEALLTDLVGRLQRFGITARAAIAGTLGAAHALTRFSTSARTPWVIAAPGDERRALEGLPVEALRLMPDAVLLLRRLGLRRIGQLYDLPRAALEKRFHPSRQNGQGERKAADAIGAVLTRLDQALGMQEEPRRPLREPPLLGVRRTWAEPLISSDALVAEIVRLTEDMCASLKDTALGLRRVRLSLYRADGTTAEIETGFGRASRDAGHVTRLLGEKLAGVEAGFGIDVAALDAIAVERLDASQIALDAGRGRAESGDCATFVDRLVNRLGASRVYCLAPQPSHMPERASVRAPALASTGDFTEASGGHLRPHLLLASPETISVMAEVPEGPPRQFTWRRALHRIVKAEGPERIEPEWWRWLARPNTQTAGGGDGNDDNGLGELVPPPSRNRPRDYYRLESDDGRQFWVFREGLYQCSAKEGTPRWFVHGLFG